MRQYSPYETLGHDMIQFPNVLFLAGLNDPRVPYWEPAKLTAKLRYSMKLQNLYPDWKHKKHVSQETSRSS